MTAVKTLTVDLGERSSHLDRPRFTQRAKPLSGRAGDRCGAEAVCDYG